MPVKEMLIGGLLGDASILYPNKRSTCPRITFRHGAIQKDYLMHKYDVLKEICPSPPNVRIIKEAYGEEYWSFNTGCLPWLSELHALCWKEGKRIIGDGIRDFLTPEALAYWYMDDGAACKLFNKGCLHTNGFTRDDQQKLRKWLLELYGIETCEALDKRHQQYLIRLRKDPFLKLCALVAPFIPECMQYKLPPDLRSPYQRTWNGIDPIFRKVCSICGVGYAVNLTCTSKECRTAFRKQRNSEWYTAHRQEVLDKKRKTQLPDPASLSNLLTNAC